MFLGIKATARCRTHGGKNQSREITKTIIAIKTTNDKTTDIIAKNVLNASCSKARHINFVSSNP